MAMTLLLIVAAWILNSWIPVAIAAICQLMNATGKTYAPYTLIYKHLMVPTKLIRPHIIQDDPVPHHFASLMGGIVTLVGTIFLWLNYPIVGWIILLMVFMLQNLNFWVNFCTMYYMYYLINRIGIPGFKEKLN
tara:strand:+ start:115 stop:516 length:402 start_codon:yes stop_codon:yes gene_type:complete